MVNNLTLDATTNLLEKFSNDFNKLIECNAKELPAKRIYKIAYNNIDDSERKARITILSNMVSGGFIKKAFDTRRINQETERNPRTNLQYWKRSQPFLDDNDQNKINIFSKLITPLMEIKSDFGTQPEYHESYSRQLHDHIERVLRLKIGDQDIFRPQLEYLEQILFNRYRLSMDEINRLSVDKLKSIFLNKDEALLKRGAFLFKTNPTYASNIQDNIKYGNTSEHENIINAIFGGTQMRRAGEKSVERTITITIKENVID